MLFGRREKSGPWSRLRLWLWPRVSWRRSGLYYARRILRLPGSPYGIAMGAALGAGVSCTPFVGFHIVISAALAWVLRGNMVAAVIGTAFGNPATFPFLWAGSYELGKILLGEFGANAPAHLEYDLLHKSWQQLLPLLGPMMLGSAVIGLALGCIIFAVVYKAVAAYQESRRARFASRRSPGAMESGQEP